MMGINRVEPGQDIAKRLERLCGPDERIGIGLAVADTMKPDELSAEIDAALRDGRDVTILAAAHMIQDMRRRTAQQMNK